MPNTKDEQTQATVELAKEIYIRAMSNAASPIPLREAQDCAHKSILCAIQFYEVLNLSPCK